VIRLLVPFDQPDPPCINMDMRQLEYLVPLAQVAPRTCGALQRVPD